MNTKQTAKKISTAITIGWWTALQASASTSGAWPASTRLCGSPRAARYKAWQQTKELKNEQWVTLAGDQRIAGPALLSTKSKESVR